MAGRRASRDAWNDTYLAEATKIVETAASYGIYTLLDMHQDVLSDAFCGEGIPRWALRVGPDKNFGEKHGFPWPLDRPPPEADLETRTHGPTLPIPTRFGCTKNQTKSTWPEREVSAAAASAYGQLYDSVNPHDPERGGYGAAGGPLGALLAPRGGHVPRTQLRPWVRADQRALRGQRVRESPSDGSGRRGPAQAAAGVRRSQRSDPGGGRGRAHLLCGRHLGRLRRAKVVREGFRRRRGRTLRQPQRPGVPLLRASAKRARRRLTSPRSARRGGSVGGMLTEFGSPGWFSRFTEAAAAAESLLQSWSMWEWKTFTKDAPGEDGNVQNAAWGADKTGVGGVVFTGSAVRPKVRRQLSRAYATAVAGETLTNSFDAESAVFRLSFRARLSCALPTEIFLPSAERYPSGFDLRGARRRCVVAVRRRRGRGLDRAIVDPARVKEGATVQSRPRRRGGSAV